MKKNYLNRACVEISSYLSRWDRPEINPTYVGSRADRQVQSVFSRSTVSFQSRISHYLFNLKIVLIIDK